MEYQRSPRFQPKIDPRVRSPPESCSDLNKLHHRHCKFFKSGKCNWGWGCRFLHGNSIHDDPRRAEYRGPIVDFTQFPRPILSSPAFPSSKTEDQTRNKILRNPVVQIVASGVHSLSAANSLQKSLFQNHIDVLSTPTVYLQLTEAKSQFDGSKSDFLVYVDTTGLIVYPSGVQLNQQNLSRFIWNKWNIKTNNLNSDNLELFFFF